MTLGVFKIIVHIFKILIALFIIGAISFYILIGLGASKKLQTLWVTTAMTTMNHKWLATAIIPQETIDKIMKENRVDDSGYESEIIDLESPRGVNKRVIEVSNMEVSDDEKNSSTGEIESLEDILVEVNPYIEEGYTELEEGLYLKEVSGSGWRGYVMLVQDPLRVSLVDTPKQFVEGWTVKKMVESVGGIAGINGGGFVDGPNYDSNGGTPAGLIIENGVLVHPKEANGETYPMIGINKNGVLVLKRTTPEWALENDIQHAVSFHPYIIVNGEGIIKKGSGGWGIAPRTAIGQRKTGEILFLVIDGRQPTWSVGVDLKVVQDVLLEEDCINAAMLDGGSSTVMIYNNEFVNKPSLGKERYINNAWVVK